MNSDIILRARNLKLYFNKDKFRAVDDISFDIKKGEVFSLVGESGCGKTTTGRSLINLYPLTGGRIIFMINLQMPVWIRTLPLMNGQKKIQTNVQSAHKNRRFRSKNSGKALNSTRKYR